MDELKRIIAALNNEINSHKEKCQFLEMDRLNLKEELNHFSN